MRCVVAAVSVAVLAAGSFGSVRVEQADSKTNWTLAVVSLTSPAAPDSAQPRLSASRDRVLLSWIEQSGATATLKFDERTRGEWSQPRAVASAGDWFVNWADVPSVIRLDDGSLAAHWLQKSGPGTYAYDVKLAYSRDDGQTWTPPATPHHDGTRTEHGFASLFQVPGAGLGLMWLDGRQMREDPHAGMDAGPMSLRSATFDPAGKPIGEALVDDRVCECCPTAAAVTSDGPIVAFRNRTEDEVRDIYVSRFVDGKWTDGRPVHRDNWKIAACPVNGPALRARGRQVVIAWFTAVGDHGQVYAAFSADAGATFAEPISIDDGRAVGRVDVEFLDDGAVVSWIEYVNQRAQFRVRHITASGARSASMSVAGVSPTRSSGYPRMMRGGNELIFAWTDAGEHSQVRTAVARLDATVSGQ